MSETHHNENGSSRNLPVLASEARVVEESESAELDRPAESALPAPLIAATGGFLAGVATFVLVRILRRGNRGRRALLRRNRKRDKALEIAGSRSFLVDVHVLKR